MKAMDVEDYRPTYAHEQRELRSFDGGVSSTCKICRPDRYAIFQQNVQTSAGLIARGSGLSYVAASFLRNGLTIDMRSFDRILSFDPDTGQIEVEAGITLGTLCKFLVPHGRFLSVVAGHGQITVGGCIAADVHGKNPARDGTFSSQVLAIRLYHPARGLCDIDREQGRDIFELTCGGYGLTGVIVSARLATHQLPGNAFEVRAYPVTDPGHGAALMRENVGTNDLLYSWHDFFTRTGRGFVFAGRFCKASRAMSLAPDQRIISANWRARWRFQTHGRTIGYLQNRMFYLLNNHCFSDRTLTLAKGLFPVQGKEAYFAAFGALGFHEHQAIIPDAAFSAYIAEVRRLAKKRGDIPIMLASGKAFGGKSTLLRFAGSGICFAVDVPRSRKTPLLLDDLNDLVAEFGGKPNIIKDSTLRPRTIQSCYPEYERFRDLLRQWDPQRLFRSELSQRLAL